MTSAPPATPVPSPILAGLIGRCPRCGKGPMFIGFLTLAARCPVCSLDLGFADTGDGPSFFASFLGGFLLLAVGVTLQVAYEPPVWVYIVLLGVGTFAIIGMIRPIKGLLVALQYANKAGLGRVE